MDRVAREEIEPGVTVRQRVRRRLDRLIWATTLLPLYCVVIFYKSVRPVGSLRIPAGARVAMVVIVALTVVIGIFAAVLAVVVVVTAARSGDASPIGRHLGGESNFEKAGNPESGARTGGTFEPDVHSQRVLSSGGDLGHA